jgi:hypothetical protein
MPSNRHALNVRANHDSFVRGPRSRDRGDKRARWDDPRIKLACPAGTTGRGRSMCELQLVLRGFFPCVIRVPFLLL